MPLPPPITKQVFSAILSTLFYIQLKIYFIKFLPIGAIKFSSI
jgi:hypothetical protein